MKYSKLKILRNLFLSLVLSGWVLPFFASFVFICDYWYVVDLKVFNSKGSFSYPLICMTLFGIAMYWASCGVYIFVFIVLNKIFPPHKKGNNS
jgi:hypothetical protein